MNTYEFENSHHTWESHLTQVWSHNLNRQKALTFVQISVETLQNFTKGYIEPIFEIIQIFVKF